MPLKVWNGSAWTTALGIKVWNGSAWTNANAGYTWNGSSWVQFFPAGMVLITDQSAFNFSLAGVGGTATARYRLYSNGQAYRTNLSGSIVSINGEWLLAGAASDYEVYASWSGSPFGVTGPTGSWVSLGTDREWTLTVTNTYFVATLNVQIRLASTSTVIDTATIDFEVDSAP
jgi:hypothetical protein